SYLYVYILPIIRKNIISCYQKIYSILIDTKRLGAQNYAKETPYGGNLGNHAYIFNSPKDFRNVLKIAQMVQSIQFLGNF
ncbi:hypothetical protein BpHYR1_046301, partial [Brachionus plicatilis]